jgi:predicted nucleotidyltransferase
MEIQIKKAVKAGNSSAVILPRAWLNQEVRIELVKKTPKIILEETLEIVKKHIALAEIIGIYLVGSYARKEETNDSDIDLLIITRDTDKEMIVEGIYNILLVSKDLLKQKLNGDLFPLGQMIKEAVPLLNADYLEDIEVKITKNNTNWYIKTTKEKIELIEKSLDLLEKNNKPKVDSKIIYTIILRIRTLQIINNMIKEEPYSKKKFIKLIEDITRGKEAYDSYLAVKNNLEQEKTVPLIQAKKLLVYLKSQLEEIKKLV